MEACGGQMITKTRCPALLQWGYFFFATLSAFIFDTAVIIFPRKSVQSNDVVLVRLDNIGDFVLWLDAAKEFRKLYPKRKLTLIANQAWASLALLLPYWDEVIPIDRKKLRRNPIYRWKTLSQLHRLGFDTAIQPTFSREFLLGDSLIRASGATVRIGSAGDLSNMTPLQKRISDRWYTRLIPVSSEPMMELQRNGEFVRGLGLQTFTAGVPMLPRMTALPARLTIELPYFIISPGALWSGRLWPATRFGEVLAKLADSRGWRAILCGSPEERGLCDQVIRSAGREALNIAGETSLPELAEVVRHAAIVIGNDSSVVHIAAAVGTPSVCLLGCGHYGRFMPYETDGIDEAAPVPITHWMDCFGCNWRCTQPHQKGMAMPCISRIKVHEVLAAVEGILAPPIP
jgi:ADP-heptose:LPS heptosyltransferase